MSKNRTRYRRLSNLNTNSQVFLQACLLALKFSLACSCFYALFDSQTKLGFNVSLLCIAAALVSLIRRSGWAVPLVVLAMLPTVQLHDRVTFEAISLILFCATAAMLLGITLDFFTLNRRENNKKICATSSAPNPNDKAPITNH